MVSCPLCGTEVGPASLEYSPSGQLVCKSCSANATRQQPTWGEGSKKRIKQKVISAGAFLGAACVFALSFNVKWIPGGAVGGALGALIGTIIGAVLCLEFLTVGVAVAFLLMALALMSGKPLLMAVGGVAILGLAVFAIKRSRKDIPS
jgi:hypothetical protein